MHRGLFRLLLTGLVVGAVAPSTAAASSAFVDTKCNAKKPNTCTYTASFRAAPGESNELTAAALPSSRWAFRDPNSRIAPGPGCTSTAPDRVVCNARALVADRGQGPIKTTINPADAQTGDRADTVKTSGRSRVSGGSGNDILSVVGRVSVTLSGGPGDDRVTSKSSARQTLGGNSGADRVVGGPARDIVRGGRGSDTVLGGSGRDLMSGNSGNDQLLGGRGNDRMFGRSGNDRLFGNQGFDGLRGNSGNDGLAGGGGGDRIAGGTGRDRLFGNGGNDVLQGNRGRDLYRGGPGNDLLNSIDGLRERVNCGSGLDLASVDAIDALARCNSVTRR